MAARALDAKAQEAADLLHDLGISRATARTILFLAGVDEATSADIATGTDLRQPEVSVATRDLRDRGWAEKRDMNRPGKGRPVHAYRLTVTLPDLVARIEAQKRADAERTAKALARLRELSGAGAR